MLQALVRVTEIVGGQARILDAGGALDAKMLEPLVVTAIADDLQGEKIGVFGVPEGPDAVRPRQGQVSATAAELLTFWGLGSTASMLRLASPKLHPCDTTPAVKEAAQSIANHRRTPEPSANSASWMRFETGWTSQCSH